MGLRQRQATLFTVYGTGYPGVSTRAFHSSAPVNTGGDNGGSSGSSSGDPVKDATGLEWWQVGLGLVVLGGLGWAVYKA